MQISHESFYSRFHSCSHLSVNRHRTIGHKNRRFLDLATPGSFAARDALGRVTRSSEILLGQAQPDKQYQYDTAGRLIKASQGALSITWGYDANGNRMHKI